MLNITGEPEDAVQVQYANEWKKRVTESTQASKIETIKADHDWTFTTNYKGTYKCLKRLCKDNENENENERKEIENEVTVNADADGNAKKRMKESRLNKLRIETTEEKLNMELLKDETEPILWHDCVMLFEDELSDSGLSQLIVRIRVMPKCFLILCRCWMRCDNVIIRVNDTRIYHEYNKNYVIRNYQERQVKWDEMNQHGLSTDCAQYTKPNLFYTKIPLVNETFEKIFVE